MEWIQKIGFIYVLSSTALSIPFLFWWSTWRKKHRLKTEGDTLILLFIIRDRGTNRTHSVFFSEQSGTTCESLGSTGGRYENLHYICPDYEFKPEPILVNPKSFKTEDLHLSIGVWIDKYWEQKFKDKK